MATFFRRILNKRCVNTLVQHDRFIGCSHRPVISKTNMTTRFYSSSSSSSSPSSTKKNNTTPTAPQKELHFVHVQHIHPRDLAQSTFFALHRPLLTFGIEQMQTIENGQSQQVWEEEDYEENSGSNANAIPLANPLSPYLTTTPFHPNQPTISMSASESQYVVNRFFSEIKLKFNQEQEQSLNKQKTTITYLEVNNIKQQEQSTSEIDFEERKKREKTLYLTNILQKRRLKMNKHKHKKLRKRTRALRKRLGKI
ncbi:8186_t:CDS:2 [Funneliformis geosporum]|uniref:Small ribosomal subunit protein mS38 n=1 Tax=Funneliformis geosporum TaxID=1117311 RepID=A0A9W4SKD3_9GLOM|nr:8186_t:CDS:2 [Funneliformis geosporum]CAI2172692.1 11696_t:CDS:2 [Funneliformis geosporum]